MGLVRGAGWADDFGYGGLDHGLAPNSDGDHECSADTIGEPISA